MTDDAADRQQAIEEVRADRARTEDLMTAIDPGAFETVGLGGGDWPLKDLLGHLEAWEQHALDAIGAWGRGEQPAVADALRTLGTDGADRRAAAEKADRPAEAARAG